MASIRISSPRAGLTRASISSASIRSSRKWSPTCRMRRFGTSIAAVMIRKRSMPPMRPRFAHTGAPTVILAKTVKGFGMGKAGEGLNSTHQQKKLTDDNLKEVRDRFNIQITDEEIAGLSFRKPAPDSEEMRYLQDRRAALGGYLPARSSLAPPLVVPPLEAFSTLLEGTGDREISTTMALVRMMTSLVKDKNIGKHIVPIVPDEARTFGNGRDVSGRLAFIPRLGSSTRRRTPISSCFIARISRDKFSRRASTRREACAPGSPQPRPIRTMA